MANVRERWAETALARTLFVVLCSLVFFTSCAPKRVEVPVYEGADPADVLSAMDAIRELEATFSIEFEKDGSLMRGDAVLRLTPDMLDLQVYTFGFLVGEVTSDATTTRSEPPMDRNKLSILVDGIRNSFFWWSIKAPAITSEDGLYRVANSWRRLFLDRRTMMPAKQIIDLDDGRQLTVVYEEPALMEGEWFPSRMRIELLNQALSLRIKTLSFKK
ncbi:MAG TPA: hypothetical protein VED67_00555 [Thermodesulfovibrionales bacterium]|nr:hypothetical protein [Thermodesulfovibrionales bacterium]